MVIQEEDLNQACPGDMALREDIFHPFCKRRDRDAPTKEDKDMSTICQRFAANEHGFERESFMQEFGMYPSSTALFCCRNSQNL